MPPAVSLSAAQPGSPGLEITFVEVERDRAFGVQLHVATRHVRPKLMAALWVEGDSWRMLAAVLRSLVPGEVYSLVQDRDIALRFAAHGQALAVTVERPATLGHAGLSLTLVLDGARLDALYEFVDDVAGYLR